MLDQAEGLRKEFMGVQSNTVNQKIITIASGKGGVGKSNIAVSLGIALSNLKEKVLVIDADLGLANINVLVGQVSDYNIFHVIKDLKTMDEVVMDTPYNIRIISGASGFSQIANIADSDRKNFINGIEKLNDENIIIIDTGAGIARNVISFAACADETIVVTTPEPTSITDAYGIIKAISMEPNKIDVKLLINRVKSTVEAKKVSSRIISIAKQFLDIDVEYLGFIFEDSIVPYSVIHQVPFYAYDNRSKASLCLDHIANRILNVNDRNFQKRKGISGLVDTFMNMYSKQ